MTRGDDGRTPRLWRRGRLSFGVLGLVAVVGVVLLATSGFQGSLTYYKTPSELSAEPPAAGQQVRLGGLVVRGTVHHHGSAVRFRLTDGVDDIDVVTHDAPPQTFRAGQGAVVQGRLGTGGVFRANQVMVRHSNEYEPPSDVKQ